MTSARNPRPRYSRPELRFWQQAFLGAEVMGLLRNKRLTPQGLAHLSAEYADAAVAELRARK